MIYFWIGKGVYIMTKNYLTPPEILQYTCEGGKQKVNREVKIVLFMGILAGIYIALGGFASSVAAHGVVDKGLSKLVAGSVFPIGLMFVVINGADLFTGNCLIAVSSFHKRTTWQEFLKNLCIVLIGNFIGAVSIAFIVANTDILSMSEYVFGGYALKTAIHKVNLSFKEAFLLGIICNLFVCGGIFMMYAAKDIAGKVLAGFFAIFAFVISGAEHVVANMYYIPIGLFSKQNSLFIEAAHLSTEQVASLTWKTFFIHNILPVTLGNLVGGLILAAIYYAIYKKDMSNI